MLSTLFPDIRSCIIIIFFVFNLYFQTLQFLGEDEIKYIGLMLAICCMFFNFASSPETSSDCLSNYMIYFFTSFVPLVWNLTFTVYDIIIVWRNYIWTLNGWSRNIFSVAAEQFKSKNYCVWLKNYDDKGFYY